nr:methylated-DNA--protein-cysteine methyltransferase [Columba livia]
MASRLVPKVAAEEGGSGCTESHAVLLSPVGKLEISGCETGLHEIKLPQPSALPSGCRNIPELVALIYRRFCALRCSYPV